MSTPTCEPTSELSRIARALRDPINDNALTGVANHELMFALFVARYNFCRPHMTLKSTPAVAAGMTEETWSVERLLKESATTITT